MAALGALGARLDNKLSLDDVKVFIMKDLKFFLEDAILPEIEKKLNPSQESVPKAKQSRMKTERKKA